jgi:TPR repeat protein
VPSAYRRFFAHYAENRSLPEKALNLVGLTSQNVGRSFALIAGVTRYPNMPPSEQDLPAAAADLRQLQAYLTDQERFDEVVVLKDGDVSYENLRYFLEVYFPGRLKASPRSRFLFAYSGHGITDNTRGFILLGSAHNMEDKENSLNLKVIRDLMESVVDAGHQVLVLLNACYSGAFLGRPFGPTRYVPRDPGAHAITAGGSKELTWHDPSLGPGSVFFEKVFAGLSGLADSSPINADGSRGDGIITVDELASYLKQEIRIFSDQRQNPMEGDISKNGSTGSFFFLNRRRQVEAGFVRDWNPARATAFGIKSEEKESEGRRFYREKKYSAARLSFQESAAGGNASAMNYLGLLYSNGEGVPKDLEVARQWYEKAIAAGSIEAMSNLADLYAAWAVVRNYNGTGSPTDFDLAKPLYEKAIAAGSTTAMYRLAYAYHSGSFGAIDDTLARQWWEKAAAAGNTDAMVYLGLLYEDGEGVPRNYALARQWYEKAAAAGDTVGMDNLGNLYARGWGVPQDYALARQWYEKAAAKGDKDAKESLSTLPK